MEDNYRKYFLTDDRIVEILRSGVVIFDTSALLDLYGFSADTQRKILRAVFGALKDRLWMPGQVRMEFWKNREKAMKAPARSYELLIKKENDKDSGHVENMEKLASGLIFSRCLFCHNGCQCQELVY